MTELWQASELFRVIVVFAGGLLISSVISAIVKFRLLDYRNEKHVYYCSANPFHGNVSNFTKRLFSGLAFALLIAVISGWIIVNTYLSALST